MSPQAKGSVQVRSSLNKRRNDVGPRSELRARMCSTLLMLLFSICLDSSMGIAQTWVIGS